MYVFRLCDIVYHALQYMSYIIWFPNSDFRSNYCGGCNAVYVDGKGNEVDCGIAEFRRRNLRRSNDHRWNRSFISNIWITTAKLKITFDLCSTFIHLTSLYSQLFTTVGFPHIMCAYTEGIIWTLNLKSNEYVLHDERVSWWNKKSF